MIRMEGNQNTQLESGSANAPTQGGGRIVPNNGSDSDNKFKRSFTKFSLHRKEEKECKDRIDLTVSASADEHQAKVSSPSKTAAQGQRTSPDAQRQARSQQEKDRGTTLGFSDQDTTSSPQERHRGIAVAGRAGGSSEPQSPQRGTRY